jgi:hypothetical protein
MTSKTNWTREEYTEISLRLFKSHSEQASKVMQTISALVGELRESGMTHTDACNLIFAEAWGWQANVEQWETRKESQS